MATGVLPLCINRATKLVQFLMCCEKEYEGRMRLGVETDTQDMEGAVLGTNAAVPRDRAAVEEALAAFKGDILQTPPMFSALKRGGVPLYRLARQGKTVERQERRVTVFELEVMAFEPPEVAFRVVCSHGTYVRTLCHDIGRRLSCGAALTRLTRVRNGGFHVRDAISLEAIEGLSHEDLCSRHLIPLHEALRGLPEVMVNDALASRLRNGLSVTAGDVGVFNMPPTASGQLVKVCAPGGLVGVIQMLSGDGGSPAWKTVRVFAA
jgi:tRNA pseudouridine55 synthase